MGTLGFLGEWRWDEHMSAVDEVFKGMARVLRRERLKVGVYDRDGKRVGGDWGEVEGIGGMFSAEGFFGAARDARGHSY